jgi:hypothetical protein
LPSTREKTDGSLMSDVQVIVTEPPDAGLEEDIDKFDNPRAKGRKKRMLKRKDEKENKRCEG